MERWTLQRLAHIADHGSIHAQSELVTRVYSLDDGTLLLDQIDEASTWTYAVQVMIRWAKKHGKKVLI